jgi:hypothetical protein
MARQLAHPPISRLKVRLRHLGPEHLYAVGPREACARALSAQSYALVNNAHHSPQSCHDVRESTGVQDASSVTSLNLGRLIDDQS